MQFSVRLDLLAIATLVVAIGAAVIDVPARAQDDDPQYQFLFVQNATSGNYDGTRLTLENVGPTILFTDRPQRITGHMRTDHFVNQWGKGGDSFQDDPPNAAFSVYTKDSLETAVIEISDPRLEGTALSYAVTVLDGKLHSSFEQSSLFIDILGRGAAFIGGAAVGSAVARSRSQQQTTTEATHTYTTAPPPPSSECAAAQQQLLAATTEEETKLATQKVQVICGN